MKKLLFLSVLPLLSCGCVAFDVGRPETVETFEYKSATISLGEAPRTAISAAPAVRQDASCGRTNGATCTGTSISFARGAWRSVSFPVRQRATRWDTGC